MNLYPHPNPKRKFKDYNAKVESGNWRSGHFALAVDIWSYHDLIFSTYSPSQAEKMEEWAARNFPVFEHPPYADLALGMGAAVAGIDRSLVPTRKAFDHAISLTEVCTIIEALFWIARNGASGPTPALPNPNLIRQRLHHKAEDWEVFRVTDHENQIAMRCVIGHSHGEGSRMATYQATWGGTAVDFTAPHVDLSQGFERRSTVARAKKELGLSYQVLKTDAQSPDGVTFVQPGTGEVMTLSITNTEEPDPVDTSGFDISATEAA